MSFCRLLLVHSKRQLAIVVFLHGGQCELLRSNDNNDENDGGVAATQESFYLSISLLFV